MESAVDRASFPADFLAETRMPGFLYPICGKSLPGRDLPESKMISSVGSGCCQIFTKDGGTVNIKAVGCPHHGIRSSRTLFSVPLGQDIACGKDTDTALTMHARFIPPIIILCLAVIRAATIFQIAADNEALTKMADTVDAAIVEITAQSGYHAAHVWLKFSSPCIFTTRTLPSFPQTADKTHQQIPRHLYNLTRAIGTIGYNDTRTDTETTSDPALEDTVTQSYGLFTNTIEELMLDLSDKETILASYYRRKSIYRQILYFNSTFVVSCFQ